MAKRRTAPTGARDQLRDDLQEISISQAIGKSDRRSLQRTRRAERELSRSARPSQIAESLGISTQKWVALRSQIRSKRATSAPLADLLEATRTRASGVPNLRGIDYVADIPHEGRRRRSGQIWYFNNDNWIKEHAPWMRDLKPGGFMDEKSAMNWWGNAGAGSQYFAMVRKKYGSTYRYHIYDMRTEDELGQKGEAGGSANLEAVRMMEEDSDNLDDFDYEEEEE